jgi:hypothetical protein
MLVSLSTLVAQLLFLLVLLQLHSLEFANSKAG